MTLTIKQTDVDSIIAHAKAGLPNEACGLIAGRIQGDIKHIEKVYMLSNPDQSPEHFSIDPKEQLMAVKDMRAIGLVPLGNFHSHPATPARPSEEDIRLAYHASASYLILSLMGEMPIIKSFHIENGDVRPESLEVIRI